MLTAAELRKITHGERYIFGQGDISSRIFYLGEAPGWQEWEGGENFIGASGEVLWQFSRRYAGVERSEVYVRNLVPKPVDDDNKNQAKMAEHIQRWEALTYEDLAIVQPELIVGLGAHASRWLLPDVEDFSLQWAHGQVFHNSLLGTDIIPCYHPAAGLHDKGASFTPLVWDLMSVGAWKDHCGEAAKKDLHPRPVYSWGAPTACGRVLAVDTEGYEGDEWCVQVSDRAGTAWLVSAYEATTVTNFFLLLKKYRPLLVFHNALHDLTILRGIFNRYGLDFDSLRLSYVDTMVLAYECQDLPRGLKPLARRLTGLHMKGFKDVVGPIDDKIMTTYLEQVVAEPDRWPAGEGRKHGIVRLTKSRLKKGQGLRKAWEEIEEKLRAPVLKALGEPPGLDGRVLLKDPDFFRYACKDPDATTRVYPLLKGRIKAYNLQTTMLADHGAMPMLDRMKRVGLWANRPKLEAFLTDLEGDQEGLAGVVQSLTGRGDFNPGSSKQVGEYLYEECKVDPIRWTKKDRKPSTDAETIQKLGAMEGLPDRARAFLDMVLEYRRVAKLAGSYVRPLVTDRLDANDIYHPDFRPSRDEELGEVKGPQGWTYTGRLAEWILTFPAGEGEARRVRDAFQVREETHELGSADLSQLELRIVASESGDPVMCKAFQDGEDIHEATAKLLGIDRKPAKTVNFRIVYDPKGEPRGLSEKLKGMGLSGWGVEEAANLVQDWYRLYGGVKTYMAERVAFARRYGYTVDMWGRRRWLPAAILDGGGSRKLRSLDLARVEAERQAGNHPIQGGAAGLVKRAMWRLEKELVKVREGDGRPARWVEALLQYHDELVLEYEEVVEREIRQLVLWALTADGPRFNVPIKAGWVTGRTWGELKD